MIEYYEEQIEGDPTQAYPRRLLEEGFAFQGTGDAVIDKWERAVAEEKPIDFAADLGLDSAQLDGWLKRKGKPMVDYVAKPAVTQESKEELPEGFSDKYGDDSGG